MPGSTIHGRKQIGKRLLAGYGVRPARTQRVQCAVDGFIDDVPIGRGARLQPGFGIVPGDLEILNSSLCGRQVSFVDEGCRISDNGPK